MAVRPNKFSRFWQEVKRRKTDRVIVLYAAAAFTILELADILAPALSFPDWTITFLIVILAIGFPVTVVFSWFFDFTPGGIEKTIAVIPFENLSGNKENEWFGDALTDEIIMQLCKINTFDVRSRTTMLQYKQTKRQVLILRRR